MNGVNNYNLNSNNRNYWNEIIYMIHEMNVNEMIVPVHNRDYLLGVISAAAASESSSAANIVETPVEIFKRLEISVTKMSEQVQVQEEKEEEEDYCSVCKEVFSDKGEKDKVVTTGCKHLFHACCLATWVKTKKTCPNCREPIVKLFL
jgi:formate dehydrogenase maturation protein FdhE